MGQVVSKPAGANPAVNPHTIMQRTCLLALSLLCLAVPSRAQGRLFVANDEWTLSDAGFSAAPDTGLFVRNLASWFIGGGAGNFLAYSSDFSLTQGALAAEMAGSGHQWTVSTTVPFTLANLLTYDAVFVAGAPAPDPVVLRHYLLSGGCVYVAAGANGFASAAAQADHWNAMMEPLGLSYAPAFDTGEGVMPIQSAHPIFQGVTGLYQKDGQSITDLDAVDPSNEVLVDSGPLGLYAIFESAPCGMLSHCTLAPNSAGPGALIGALGSSSIGANNLTLTCDQLPSTQPGLFFYGHLASELPFGDGLRCVGGSILRLMPPLGSGTGGSVSLALDLTSAPLVGSVVAGETLHFQFWYRDPAAGGTGFNMSDALAIKFCQ